MFWPSGVTICRTSATLFLNLLSVCIVSGFDGSVRNDIISTGHSITEQDSVRERQHLYIGTLWTNRYHRIEGDQFLFSGLFLTGTVSVNSIIFRNVRLKYDIYSDEIITPINKADILQLNKEMVDSFTLAYENKTYRFINFRNDTLNGLSGYVNLLYHGKSSLYVRYKKSITPTGTSRSDGKFNQNQMLYLVKGNQVFPFNRPGGFYKILNTEKDQIRNFIRKNRLKVSGKIPESFVPVIIFHDSLSK